MPNTQEIRELEEDVKTFQKRIDAYNEEMGSARMRIAQLERAIDQTERYLAAAQSKLKNAKEKE